MSILGREGYGIGDLGGLWSLLVTGYTRDEIDDVHEWGMKRSWG